jgi:hypothetical protein
LLGNQTLTALQEPRRRYTEPEVVMLQFNLPKQGEAEKERREAEGIADRECIWLEREADHERSRTARTQNTWRGSTDLST